MKYHKLIAGETTGTYVMESPVTEADILQMAQQLAMSRLSKGRTLTDPKQVFSHLQTLLQYHEYEVFALLLLDTKHRVISFQELFRGTLDGACVYPREVVKIALEHNAAAVILCLPITYQCSDIPLSLLSPHFAAICKCHRNDAHCGDKTPGFVTAAKGFVYRSRW